jgi:hypothetical protein
MKQTIVLWMSILLAGCSMGGLVSISDPYITDSGMSLNSGVLELGNIGISVKPQTYKVGLLAVGPILPIIPLGPGNDFDRQNQNLKVIIQFETEHEGFSISPSSTTLILEGSEIAPNRYSGLLSKITYPREAAKATPGHEWICETHSLELTETNKEQDYVLNTRAYIVIEFPVRTPETTKDFSIILKGIRQNGQPVPIPIFHFKPGSSGSYSIMG